MSSLLINNTKYSNMYKWNLFKKLFTETTFINIIAFCFIALSIIEIFFGIQFTESEKVLPRFIKDIVFLNAIHLGFSFILIFDTIPFLNWRKSLPKIYI